MDYKLQRDDIIKRMTEIAVGSRDRRGLIAAGIALQLCEDPATLFVGRTPMKTWAVDAFGEMRAKVRTLAGEYATASGTRRKEIARVVLAEGLPGDPLISEIWEAAAR